MSPQLLVTLASVVFWLHVLTIAFNVCGLIVIPVGAWRHWTLVRVFWLRALHLAVVAVVALQALLDHACFLTAWQADLLEAAGQTASRAPLIQRWVEHLVFWPLPLWFFTLLYGAVFIYVVILWRLVSPIRLNIRSGPSR